MTEDLHPSLTPYWQSVSRCGHDWTLFIFAFMAVVAFDVHAATVDGRFWRCSEDKCAGCQRRLSLQGLMWKEFWEIGWNNEKGGNAGGIRSWDVYSCVCVCAWFLTLAWLCGTKAFLAECPLCKWSHKAQILFVCSSVCDPKCVCVYVCVCIRERERERAQSVAVHYTIHYSTFSCYIAGWSNLLYSQNAITNAGIKVKHTNT